MDYLFKWWYLFDIFDHFSFNHTPYYSITRVCIFYFLCFLIYFKFDFKLIQKDVEETKAYNAPVSMILFFSGLIAGASFKLFLIFTGIFIGIPLILISIPHFKSIFKAIRWSVFWFTCFIISLLLNLILLIC